MRTRAAGGADALEISADRDAAIRASRQGGRRGAGSTEVAQPRHDCERQSKWLRNRARREAPTTPSLADRPGNDL